LSVAQIVTPMLVIHGDKDYRVPIGEGLRLWYELLSSSGLPADAEGRTAHRFLYFPDENHWILTPQHAKVWYHVVTAFRAEHVLGQPAPALPEVLGCGSAGGGEVDRVARPAAGERVREADHLCAAGGEHCGERAAERLLRRIV